MFYLLVVWVRVIIIYVLKRTDVRAVTYVAITGGKIKNPFTPMISILILLTICHRKLFVSLKNLVLDQLTFP